jgi:hypothetical protein
MVLPVLGKPFLLSSSLAGSVTSIDTLQTYLEGHFKFLDLEPIKPKLARETLENAGHPRENRCINQGRDWDDGRQAAWVC